MISFAWLSWFNPKRLAIAAGMAVALWIGVQTVQFVDQAMEDRQRVIVLEIENQSLRQNLETEMFLRTEQERATQAAESALEAELARQEAFQDIENGAISAPPEDDAPVAPVLRDTLQRLNERYGG